jgi:hypothetical protein
MSRQFKVGSNLLVHPLRERSDAFQALNPAGEISERLAPALEDTQSPLRLRRDIEDVGKGDLWRHCHAVFNVTIPLALDLQIHGRHEGAAFRGDSAFNEFADESTVRMT